MRVARFLVPALLVAIIGVIVVFAVVVTSSHPTLTADSQALATIKMPTGGGTVKKIEATGGRQQRLIPVGIRGDKVYPTTQVGQGEKIKITAVIQRPAWIGWLSGKTQTLKLTVTTPSVRLRSRFVTRPSGKAVMVKYREPVESFGYGKVGSTVVSHGSATGTKFAIKESDEAGTVAVAAAPRSWEKPFQANISWFPAGAKATVVVSPKIGTQIEPSSPLKLTFSKPLTDVLGKSLPVVTPSTTGAWKRINSHSIEFEPTGYGYGLSTDVSLQLPAGVRVIGASSAASTATWSVPQGTTLRLQQLLAGLGYLPVNFKADTTVPNTTAAQEAAAVKAPQGSFSWRYAGTPGPLQNMWTPGDWSELMKGAVMAFESDNGLAVDGIPGPQVWKTLIEDTLQNKQSTFGYTFVYVTEGEPEHIEVWHSGKVVVSGPANTGIPEAPTAIGTYAVYERETSGTMTGTNPDGSAYHDTDIPWISYFNGGDALHGFLRSSYGFRQSLGCVEMPYSEAGAVYPYTPIGTIVNIVG